MRDVTIVADDLTGAADCGIAFAASGLSTFVAIDHAALPGGVRVVAVDIDSRQLPPDIAKNRAFSAAQVAYRDGSRVLYKKIDSTLRGHPGIEIGATIAAAEDAAKAPAVLVVAAHAFPGTGRVTRGGRTFVGDAPLEDTEIWKKSGMSGPADLPSMLGAAGVTTALCDLARVRGERAELSDALIAAVATGAKAVVCDAETEDDLARIARAGGTVPLRIVWVGSAGLARHLPRALDLATVGGRAKDAAEPRIRANSTGPVVTVVGSRAAISGEQASRLASATGVESFVFPPGMLEGRAHPGWPTMERDLDRALHRGSDLLITLDVTTMFELSQGPAIAAALAAMVVPFASRIGGVAATGGDTARALMLAMGVHGLYLLEEVEPGVPMGILDTVSRANVSTRLPMITKAGAFGTPDTLVRCREALKGEMTRG